MAHCINSKTLSARFISLPDLIILGTHPKHEFPGQRNHSKGIERKRHVQGELKGDSRVFAAVLVQKTKKLMLIDGYHRVAALETGLARLPAGATLLLVTHTVRDMEAAEHLYKQFNSMAAAKKSGCHFDSALRKAKLINVIKSPLVLEGGKATGAQLAAGMPPSKTYEAATAVMDGIKRVDAMQLSKHRHEIGGVIGAYFAIAHHCKDEALVRTFITNVNNPSFAPSKPTAAHQVIIGFAENLKARVHTTGGHANRAAFETGLAAFITYVARSRRTAGLVNEQSLTLAQFCQVIQQLK